MTAPYHPRHPDRVGSPSRPRNGRTIRRTPDPEMRFAGDLPLARPRPSRSSLPSRLIQGGQGRTAREIGDATTALAGFVVGGLAALVCGAVAVGVARLLWAVVTVWAAAAVTGGAS